MKKLLLAAVALGLLAACSNTATTTTVAAAEVGLTAAEATALHYVALPPCVSGGPPLCSTAAAIAKIKLADDAAYNAVKAAEGGTGTAAAAAAAIAALTTVIPAL